MMSRFSLAVMATLLLWNCAGEAQDPAGTSPSPTAVMPADWARYADDGFGFSVAYPPDYVILPQSVLPAGAQPAPAQRVWFQEKSIAAGEFAGQEPARLAIHVYAKPAGVGLSDWLRSAGLMPAGAAAVPARLDGAREGLRVALRQQLAPNEFVYFATDKYVYQLVPLGEHSAQMLESFRLTAP